MMAGEGSKGVEGLRCVVTGGSGFVGRRLVEMLVERGAKHVVSFDIRNPDPDPLMEFLSEEQKAKVTYIQGDLTKPADVSKACEGADAVWHIAALVGPFHKHEMYLKVNYEGSLNVLNACKEHGITRLVASSSPSTRFDGSDIYDLTEDQLKIQEPGHFMQAYAETKAMGEMAIREASSDTFFTVAVAPHQVYGPRDGLFLPNLMYACRAGKLRIFGNGQNRVSFTHVDNYCHGLIIALDKLYKGSPACGKFYVVTDDEYLKFWDVLDSASVELGYGSLWAKTKLPYSLLMFIAYFLKGITMATGHMFRVNPFTVKMLTIHRAFNITNAKRDLDYKPVISFEDGWKQTTDWFKANNDWWISRAEATMK
ncbi:3 beta-hydroxysteroid dehydrogenase type 4 [Hondaea fermentalgiana]|uniref:3 beta-hydroxysteroid dehydrogenase type 4 n=1 Tax=Hondaea fermentalgiana TaxID=2315210 RepID=A0A2R5G012_9STRA|nr:3 beta-hydroxysteroid dehydrogenase type 4 [Hondaea fermentalgiana]|eukprot:GBG24352.1 3 beta-hydroxysteroid dehydrogenase type 4 [Hondaea fermentalgiana]